LPAPPPLSFLTEVAALSLCLRRPLPDVLSNANANTAGSDSATATGSSSTTTGTTAITAASNRTYTYDPIGNRLTSADGSTASPTLSQAYTTNNLNQYTAIQTTIPTPPTTATPTYDDDGNTLADGTGKVFVWDAENRLTQVTLPNSEIVRYYYDGISRRVKREHITPTKTTTTTYLYDGWNVIHEPTTTAEMEDNTTSYIHSSRFYTWGLDLSNTHQAAGGVGGLLATTHIPNATLPTQVQRYHHTYDVNGNTSELADANGITQAHYEYDAFGKEIVSTENFADSNIYRFSTKPYDFITGINYFGFRFYLSSAGRWINRDILEEFGGQNLYAGMLNNVIVFYDYLGGKGYHNPSEDKGSRECCHGSLSDGIKKREGFSEGVYDDPRKGKAARTIGYGFNLDAIGPDLKKQGYPVDSWLSGSKKITRAEADRILEYFVNKARNDAISILGGDCVQRIGNCALNILSEMAYQMGKKGLSRYVEMRGALCDNRCVVDFASAAKEMLDSEWYRKQTPGRAKKLSDLMKGNAAACAPKIRCTCEERKKAEEDAKAAKKKRAEEKARRKRF
jgi:RHS repeat-associated protein